MRQHHNLVRMYKHWNSIAATYFTAIHVKNIQNQLSVDVLKNGYLYFSALAPVQGLAINL